MSDRVHRDRTAGAFPRTLALCAFAAAMARRDGAAAARALGAARRAGTSRAAVEETALMLVLYAGYPAALEALRLLQQTWPGGPRPAREGSRAGWRSRGERLCRKVYGPLYPRLLDAVRGLHPDLAVWMVEEGYGRVLSRPRLAAPARELVTVAVLGATGWRRQLASHLRGARRLGARTEQIRAALRVGLRRAGRSARREAGAAWEECFGSQRRPRRRSQTAG